ncbi:adenylylsulfate kinase [Gelidibacter sediminis]|uniref:Adenylyl-sulfate kinase n=1 Tax=Gelidibacter sediminis TaxID=1608710 RepID=A0A4R7PLL2_9FLAO|nr:adenylyl-sulfate kinase [Gelidibacter sediminis]TDU34430.1 adenylylsulfate kinase [Gelidibacter sediminis]
MSLNLYDYNYKITRADREKLHGHEGFLIWFTGLSGSGKSTLANAVETQLHKMNISTFTLDGDNVRQGINKDLGFSPQDRSENIRRIGEIAKLMVDAGVVTLAAFISPYIKDRHAIKTVVGNGKVIEVYVNTSLEECERRDVKGLYKKAREGKIKEMTGISSPYEAPISPDLEIVTDHQSVETSVALILEFIIQKLKKGI